MSEMDTDHRSPTEDMENDSLDEDEVLEMPENLSGDSSTVYERLGGRHMQLRVRTRSSHQRKDASPRAEVRTACSATT